MYAGCCQGMKFDSVEDIKRLIWSSEFAQLNEVTCKLESPVMMLNARKRKNERRDKRWMMCGGDVLGRWIE